MVNETAFEVVWHVLRRGEDTEVGRILTMEVAGAQGGKNRRRKNLVGRDLRVMGVGKGRHIR